MDAVESSLNDRSAPRREREAAGGRTGKHIVDVLIEERARHLVHSPLWPLYRAALYPILKYRAAVRMADSIADLPGRDVMRRISDILDLDVRVKGLDATPANGRVIIAPTHPTGIADGVAMFDALKDKRPDMTFFANRDAIRVAPGLSEMLIPVEWVEDKRTMARSRETLRVAKAALAEDRCIVLFASGRIAAMGPSKTLIEREWMNTVSIFARKYDCPVVPAYVGARNSWLYYWFWRLSDELRDITLFNELLNKRGKRFDITFGELIPPERLAGDHAEVAAALRRYAVEDVPAGRPWPGLDQSCGD